MATYNFHVNKPNEIGKRRDRVSSKELSMAKDDLNESGMIKLKDLLVESVNPKPYFRAKLWNGFQNAARYKKDKYFYNDLVKIVMKSKLYPHAGKNEITLHGKIVFTKAFDDFRKEIKGVTPDNTTFSGLMFHSPRAKRWHFNYKGWERYIEDFIEAMEMYHD